MVLNLMQMQHPLSFTEFPVKKGSSSPVKVAMGKIKDEFELFFQTVSIRGVPRIFTSRQIIIAGFWLVTVLIFFAILIWQLCLLLIKYFSYPYSSTTKEENVYPVFPTLSICNLNPILMVTANFTSILSWAQHLKNVQNVLAKTDYSKITEEFGSMSKDEIQSYIRDLETASGYFSNFPIYDLFTEESKNDMIVDYGILDWNWMRANITASITPYWDSNYFNCYSLTLQEEDRSKVQMVSLVVYINNFPDIVLPGIYQLGGTVSRGVGAGLRIHYPDTRGNMKQSINLSPGMESTFFIEMTNRTRLNYPYNKWNCTSEDAKSETGFLYNINDCIELCIQQQIVDKCKCISINHIFSEVQLKQANRLLCGNMSDFGDDNQWNGPKNSQNFYTNHSDYYPNFLRQLACVNTIKTAYNDSCISKCLLPCKEILYKYSGMSTEWPDVTNHLSVYRRYVVKPASRFINKKNFAKYHELDKPSTNSKMDDTEIIEALKNITTIRNNFLQINVIFQSRYSHYIEDSETVTSQSLLSSIGGCLSLWLGLSFMTIAEVIEFIIRVTKVSISSGQNLVKVKPTKEPTASF